MTFGLCLIFSFFNERDRCGGAGRGAGQNLRGADIVASDDLFNNTMDGNDEEDSEQSSHGNDESLMDQDELLVDDSDDEEEELGFGDTYGAAIANNQFVNTCMRFSQDSPHCKKLFTKLSLDDDRANRLGRALTGNTHVKFLTVRVPPNLSLVGAQSLVDGISNSKIETLALSPEYGTELRPSPEVVHLLYAKSLQALEIHFNISDEDAALLGNFLITARETFKKLGFQHRNLTHQGAQVLAEAIRSSHIEELELFVQCTSLAPSFWTESNIHASIAFLSIMLLET